MTNALHNSLIGPPKHWQEMIIRHAMGSYFCDNCDYIEAYKAWKQIADDDNAAFNELELNAWEPFEYHSQADLWELVNDTISGFANLIKTMGAPELLEALEKLCEMGDYLNTPENTALRNNARAAISVATKD